MWSSFFKSTKTAYTYTLALNRCHLIRNCSQIWNILRATFKRGAIARLTSINHHNQTRLFQRSLIWHSVGRIIADSIIDTNKSAPLSFDTVLISLDDATTTDHACRTVRQAIKQHHYTIHKWGNKISAASSFIFNENGNKNGLPFLMNIPLSECSMGSRWGHKQLKHIKILRNVWFCCVANDQRTSVER